MKKKITMILAGVCTAALLAGCASKEISNDYITISKYKGVEVDKVEKAKVADEDVENSIASTLESKKTTTEVTDRAIQEGDTVTFDYVGKKDGEAFEGGSQEGAELKIGSDSFIEGFEDGMIGHSIGETYDLPLTFPENYGNADLAGKDVVFTITVKSIALDNIPELTDDLVKELSESSKTVEEYKKEVKKDLEKSNKDTAKTTLGEAAVAAVLKNTKVNKYPDDQVKDMTTKIKDQYTQMASYFGLEFADYLEQQMGMTEDEFNKQAKKAAKSSVKQKLAIELIAKQENLIPTDKQYEKEFKKLATQYGYGSVDELKKQVTEEDLKTVVLQEKVNDWLVENCKEVEAKADTSTKDTKEESK